MGFCYSRALVFNFHIVFGFSNGRESISGNVFVWCSTLDCQNPQEDRRWTLVFGCGPRKAVFNTEVDFGAASAGLLLLVCSLCTGGPRNKNLQGISLVKKEKSCPLSHLSLISSVSVHDC